MTFNAEYEVELILTRLTNLEEAVNKVLTAMQHVASVEALNEIVLLKQADVDALTTRVEALEAQLELLSNEIHV